MINTVKEFIEENINLLKTDPIEFFHGAYNQLTRIEQDILVGVLDNIGIDTKSAREVVLRFIVSMEISVLDRPMYVEKFIKQELHTPLGFVFSELHDYILENIDEFDADIIDDVNGYKIVPKDDN